VRKRAIRETRFVIVGNPENRRVALFQAALARARMPPARVVAWLDLLTGRDALERAVARGAMVRFESPGEDFAVERELIAIGASVEDDSDGAPITAERARRLDEDRGFILHPRQWYRGLREALRRCAQALAACPPHARMNAPAEIAVLFDKRLSHAACERGGVPVPRALGPVRSYDELRARMAEQGIQRVFVKLACGSSASGVIALQARAAGVTAETSVELVRRAGETRLYNSLRVRRYVDAKDVRDIVDRIAAEGAHVEEWIPKAGVGGRAFDLRIVVIAGAARHVVVRTSKGPLTNLHLGNRRGDPAEARARVGEERWGAALRSAERAAQLFPGALHAGVDLAIASSLRRHAVLEINAFGDLLPGVLDRGQDTYAAEIAACVPALDHLDAGVLA
jgi:glutathione synthase/RimK-type ligase-like ATP-grasp enzyme